MEFGKHIGKGLWGFADKALPAVYGIAFMLFVIRVLPVEEYGAYVLFQTVFLLIIALSYSFAVQPMLKFIAEGMDAKKVSSTALTIMTALAAFVVAILLLLQKPVAHLLDPAHAESVGSLFIYLPIMLAATIYRLIAGGLFQAKLDIKSLFWTDAVYYLLSMVLIIVGKYAGVLTNARVIIHIGIVSSVLSSVFAYFLVRPYAAPVLAIDVSALKKIFGFGKFGIAGTIGNIVMTQFDTFILSMYGGGVSGVAMYNVAKTFTRVFDIYTQVIQTLVLPASSMLQGRKEEYKLPTLVEKAICFSFYAILPAIFIFEVLPSPMFHLVYGNRYDSSIPILRIIALTGFIIPWGAVISSTMYGIGKMGVGLIMSLFSLSLSFVLYIVMGSAYGIYGISWAVVALYVIIGTVSAFVLKYYVPYSFAAILRRTGDIVTYARKMF